MFVIGGHGYVGSRVVATATGQTGDLVVVSRDGATRAGRPSISWTDLEQRLRTSSESPELIWLLDGAKHAEPDRLAELLRWVGTQTHVVFVSTCTVYGDQGGRSCTENSPVQLLSAHARLKAACEQMLIDANISCAILRLGALYGVNDHGDRKDRIEKWVSQAADQGVVTVPEPTHWRGWVHRDQAARALVRAARNRSTGVLNVATANMTFGEAAGIAASLFDARVLGDGKPDPCDYQVDSTAARQSGLLDELPGEDMASCTRAFAAAGRPSPRSA